MGECNVFQRLSKSFCEIFIDTTSHVPRSKTPNNFDEEKEWSFRPIINPISAELITKGDSDKKPPVWESLYKLNDERKIILEQKRKEKEIMQLENDGWTEVS